MQDAANWYVNPLVIGLLVWTFNFSPQITQMHADKFLCVDLRQSA